VGEDRHAAGVSPEGAATGTPECEGAMNNVTRIDEDRIKDHLDHLMRASVEETLNVMLSAAVFTAWLPKTSAPSSPCALPSQGNQRGVVPFRMRGFSGTGSGYLEPELVPARQVDSKPGSVNVRLAAYLAPKRIHADPARGKHFLWVRFN